MKRRIEAYHQQFYQLQNMMAQNTIEADKSLVTFSIAALASLAAMNERLFADYGMFSFVSILLFITVIIGVVVGYLISSELLKDAQAKLTKNFLESTTTPLDKDTDKLRFGKAAHFINWANFVCFIFGIISFVVLLMLYIKDLPNGQ